MKALKASRWLIQPRCLKERESLLPVHYCISCALRIRGLPKRAFGVVPATPSPQPNAGANVGSPAITVLLCGSILIIFIRRSLLEYDLADLVVLEIMPHHRSHLAQMCPPPPPPSPPQGRNPQMEYFRQLLLGLKLTGKRPL